MVERVASEGLCVFFVQHLDRVPPGPNWQALYTTQKCLSDGYTVHRATFHL